MFLHGPSLLLPKGLFGVQLPPLASLSSLGSDENENENEREQARRWDTIERAVLRGLVMLRSRSSASYGSDSLGEFLVFFCETRRGRLSLFLFLRFLPFFLSPSRPSRSNLHN